MDRGAQWAAAHGVVKSRTGLSDYQYRLLWSIEQSSLCIHQVHISFVCFSFKFIWLHQVLVVACVIQFPQSERVCCSVMSNSLSSKNNEVAIPFPKGSSRPRYRTWVSCIGNIVLTTGPPGKSQQVIISFITTHSYFYLELNIIILFTSLFYSVFFGISFCLHVFAHLQAAGRQEESLPVSSIAQTVTCVEQA